MNIIINLYFIFQKFKKVVCLNFRKRVRNTAIRSRERVLQSWKNWWLGEQRPLLTFMRDNVACSFIRHKTYNIINTLQINKCHKKRTAMVALKLGNYLRMSLQICTQQMFIDPEPEVTIFFVCIQIKILEYINVNIAIGKLDTNCE